MSNKKGFVLIKIHLNFLLLVLTFSFQRLRSNAFNKTYLKTVSHGTQPLIELAGWAKARRKAELKENGAGGISIQATGFYSQTSRPKELGQYFSGTPRQKISYGPSYSTSSRDTVDLQAEAMLHNAFEYKLRYAQASPSASNQAPDIFSMVSGQTTQDHILRDDSKYTFTPGNNGTGTEKSFATNLNNLTDKYINFYQSNGSVFVPLAMSRYSQLLNDFRKSSANAPAGTITLAPEQKAFGVRLNFYVNLPGAFFVRCNVPVLKVKNNLKVKFSDPQDKMADYLSGQYALEYGAAPDVVQATFYEEATTHGKYYSYNSTQAPFTENTAKSDMETALPGLAFEVKPYEKIEGLTNTNHANKNAQKPLKYSKLSPSERSSDFGFGDISLTLGIPLCQAAKYDLSFLGTLIIGTDKSKGEYLFEPMRGNGGHIGISAGLEGSADVLLSQNIAFDVFFLSEAGYLFKNKEIRTIGAFFDDTTRAPWDRYFLVGTIDQKGPLTPLANLTTGEVDVRPGMFARAAAGMSFHSCSFSLDLGWGLWTCQEESIDQKLNYPDQTYAFADPFDYRTYEKFTVEEGASFSPSNNSSIDKTQLDWSSAQTPAQIVNSVFLAVGYNPSDDPLAFHVGFAYNYCHNNSAPQGWDFFIKGSYSF